MSTYARSSWYIHVHVFIHRTNLFFIHSRCPVIFIYLALANISVESPLFSTCFLFGAVSAVFSAALWHEASLSGSVAAVPRRKRLPQLGVKSDFYFTFFYVWPVCGRHWNHFASLFPPINCTNRFNLMPLARPNKNQLRFGTPYPGTLLCCGYCFHFFGHVSVFCVERDFDYNFSIRVFWFLVERSAEKCIGFQWAAFLGYFCLMPRKSQQWIKLHIFIIPVGLSSMLLFPSAPRIASRTGRYNSPVCTANWYAISTGREEKSNAVCSHVGLCCIFTIFLWAYRPGIPLCS